MRKIIIKFILGLICISIIFLLRISLVKNTYVCSTSKLYCMTSSVKNNIVYFTIFDKDKNFLSEVDTRASDLSKWNVAWDNKKDIIILFSSDIGLRAWNVKDGSVNQISSKDELLNFETRSQELKKEKYK